MAAKYRKAPYKTKSHYNTKPYKSKARRAGNRKGGLSLTFVLALVFLLIIFSSSWFSKLLNPYPYRDMVEHHASEYALDPLLVAAVIKTESNFKPDALSPKGARGLMQIMPDTGKWIATQLGRADYQANDLLKPEVNIQMGCWYLASLYKEFHGDKVMVLAAYNGGRGNVKSWIANKKWDGKSATLEQIPFPETKTYVSKVLNAHVEYSKLYAGSQ